MPITLHAAIVPTFHQIAGAMHALLGKAEVWCADAGMEPAALFGAAIAPDMLPLAVQFKFVRQHSLNAILGAKAGLVTPDLSPPPFDFAGQKAMLAEAVAGLEAVTEAEMEALVGQDVRFEVGQLKMAFSAEQFLFSFAQPNLHFHATTAYDILRMKGMPLTKRDYLGAVRAKGMG